MSERTELRRVPVIDANTSAVASASAKDRTHGKGSCQRLVKKASFFDAEGETDEISREGSRES